MLKQTIKNFIIYEYNEKVLTIFKMPNFCSKKQKFRNSTLLVLHKPRWSDPFSALKFKTFQLDFLPSIHNEESAVTKPAKLPLVTATVLFGKL